MINLSIVSCHQSSTTGSLFALMFITMRQLHLLLVNYLNLSKLTLKNSINAIDAWNKVQTSLGNTILKDLTPNEIKTIIMKKMTDSY